MIAITGKNPRIPPNAVISTVLRPGMVLYAGTECNDGRPITESKRYQDALKMGLKIVRTKPIAAPTHKEAQLLADKYAPQSLAEVIGHAESIKVLRTWIHDWPASRAVLLVGPPGIGKTTMAHLLAKEAGYAITEYNASDARSMSMLRGIFSLGMRRLRKEIVIMDEVDGLSERGGCGELAKLIDKTDTPIICLCNALPPKLNTLQKACLVIKCSRPMKSTIATALLNVCKKENIAATKESLERMCEESGNDIRSILNRLSMHGAEKDAMLRMDLFSATQKLMSRHLPMTSAEDLVYVDYGMVPLMVQEAYIAASKDIEEAAAAAEEISFGDTVSRALWQRQDWSLLPHAVMSTVAASRKRSGPCPFQIFPRVLGKNATKGKHRRWMEEIGRIRGKGAASVRLNETEWIQKILLYGQTDMKEVITRMEAIHITRDQLMENITETLLNPVELPTKAKTTLTREYNKKHGSEIKAKKGSVFKDDHEEDEDEEDDIIE